MTAILPYAIVRDGACAPVDRGALGEAIVHIRSSGLQMIAGSEPEGRPTPDGFLQVVAAVHRETACVPMQLVQAMIDADAAVRLLCAGAARFHGLLDLFDGAEEWSLKVEPLENAALLPEEVSQSDAGESGRDYLLRRRGEVAEAAGFPRQLVPRLHDVCRRLAEHTRRVRLIPGRDACGSIVMLIDRGIDARGLAEPVAADLAAATVLTGPWPPFSFTDPN
ncbi:MAG: GvpL/GvpF family gas vesicle protein [Planctomycetota bacterium]